MADETARNEVDDAILARILRCDEATIHSYARLGIIHREPSHKFGLFPSISNVVEHLRSRAAQADAQLAARNDQALSMSELETLSERAIASARRVRNVHRD